MLPQKWIKETNAVGIISKSGNNGGSYDGKLDLPGGIIEICERYEETLKRELKEEVGINITNYQLFDTDSVSFIWKYKDNLIKVHHIDIFYKIINYKNDIKKDINIDKVNDDSLGADFYDMNKLSKDILSNIATIELEKLGYKI